MPSGSATRAYRQRCACEKTGAPAPVCSRKDSTSLAATFSAAASRLAADHSGRACSTQVSASVRPNFDELRAVQPSGPSEGSKLRLTIRVGSSYASIAAQHGSDFIFFAFAASSGAAAASRTAACSAGTATITRSKFPAAEPSAKRRLQRPGPPSSVLTSAPQDTSSGAAMDLRMLFIPGAPTKRSDALPDASSSSHGAATPAESQRDTAARNPSERAVKYCAP